MENQANNTSADADTSTADAEDTRRVHKRNMHQLIQALPDREREYLTKRMAGVSRMNLAIQFDIHLFAIADWEARISEQILCMQQQDMRQEQDDIDTQIADEISNTWEEETPAKKRWVEAAKKPINNRWFRGEVKRDKRKLKKKAGYTWIETLVVVCILSLLTGLAVTSWRQAEADAYKRNRYMSAVMLRQAGALCGLDMSYGDMHDKHVTMQDVDPWLRHGYAGLTVNGVIPTMPEMTSDEFFLSKAEEVNKLMWEAK